MPAHLRRNHRGFPRCSLSKTGAHLRMECAPSAGLALHPVPFSRKGAQPLASASIAVRGQNSFGSCVQSPLERPVVVGRAKLGLERLRLWRNSPFAAGAATAWPFGLHAGSARRKEESRTLSCWARLRMSEIYSTCGCTVLLFASQILPEVMGSLQDQSREGWGRALGGVPIRRLLK
jgi:hypothetical protein